MQERMRLYPFQQNALKQVEERNKVAFYLDMGLGKTFVGSEKLVQLGSSLNLLICQKSKIKDWIEHFKKFYWNTIVYDGTKKECLKRFLMQSRKDVQTICVINYELAWRRPELLELSDFTLMLDESSLIQNRKAKQSKFILNLEAKNVILLSGTPCSGKYENLWTQAHLLGWDISEDLFLSHYVNLITMRIGNKHFKQVNVKNPYKNIERLKRKLRENGAVFMKTEEVIDLPKRMFIRNKVDSSREYAKFKKDRIIRIDDEELVGSTQLTMRLYARMLCGHLSKEKLQAFKDLVESTNDRLIVFYNFNKELEKLRDIVEDCEKPISVINGKEKNLTAYEENEDSVTFIQYQAGAMGLNLQKANKIIYFTLPERSELFEQSKKRINRIGQDRTCFYYVMMCRDTVEESIYKCLLMRRDYTDELFKKEFLC